MRRHVYHVRRWSLSKRRKGRNPMLALYGVLLCLILGVGSSVFHVWERVFPPAALQASVQAVDAPRSFAAQGTFRGTLQTAPETDEVVERLFNLLDRELGEAISAQGAAVLDENGELLYGRNADTQRSPASMTKLMTAIVVLDAGCLEDTVTVGDLYSCYEDGSVLLYLEEGERIAMKDLLAALMILSANDAAAAVAIHVGGSIEGFAQMMNDKAEELELVNSHFVNPHGLTAEGHYTTPRDMAQIVRRASGYETIRELATLSEYHIESTGPDGEIKEYDLKSGNPFANGSVTMEPFRYLCGKTGYTNAAGLCLAAAYEDTRDGKQYYCVVMNSQAHFEDMTEAVSYLIERQDIAG